MQKDLRVWAREVTLSLPQVEPVTLPSYRNCTEKPTEPR